MALKIRLRRMGATKQPSYRVVVAEARTPRNGRFVETIGHYNPLTHPATIKINQERAQYWMSQGAQPTGVVVRLLQRVEAAPAAGAPSPAASTSPEPSAQPEESSEEQPE